MLDEAEEEEDLRGGCGGEGEFGHCEGSGVVMNGRWCLE
jgi:hypothetical protein